MFVEAKFFHKAGEGSGGGSDPHNLGYYADLTALQTAHPTGTDGDFAILGSTDTIWVWDSGTSAWKDTDTKGQVSSVNGQTGAVTIGANDVLPTQTGFSGRVLGTDGFVAGWVQPEIVQRSAMPVASQDEEGNVYQFVGTTDANYTNGYFYKCVSDGGNPPTYSWSQVNVQPAGSSLPSQTGNSGKFLTTDGTDASWANALTNRSSASGSLAIIGSTSQTQAVVIGALASAGTEATAIGYSSGAVGTESVAIGWKASANGNYSTAVGEEANASGQASVALGVTAQATAQSAIQIGSGSNSTANTLNVGLGYVNGSPVNVRLLSNDGTIPTARLTKVNTTVTLTTAGWSGGSQTVTVNGMTATGIALVSPDPTDQADYTTAGIICTAQATNSLTFTCTSTPSADIDVNVVML